VQHVGIFIYTARIKEFKMLEL